MSDRKIACRIEMRHVSSRKCYRPMFMPAQLFVSLDYPLAERETAHSLYLEANLLQPKQQFIHSVSYVLNTFNQVTPPDFCMCRW